MTLPLDIPAPEWLQVMRAQRNAGKSVSDIARECEMARSTVSMLLSDTYPAQSLDLVTRKHGAKVMARYTAMIPCPHLKRGITGEECARFAAAPMSTSNPDRLSHWVACSQCHLKAGAA